MLNLYPLAILKDAVKVSKVVHQPFGHLLEDENVKSFEYSVSRIYFFSLDPMSA